MTQKLPVHHRAVRTAVASSMAAAMLFGAVACGSDDQATVTSDNGNGAATTVTGAESTDTTITVRDAWARPSAMMQNAGAVYMEIVGGDEADELVSASVPTSVAATVELHETSKSGGMHGGMDMDDMDMDDMHGGGMDMDGMHGGGMDMDGMHGGAMDMDDMHMGGMMTMREVSSIAIPAGGTVSLEPGGLHIMLLDLADQLVAGETFEITLTFASGTTVVAPVTVRTQ